MPCVFGQHLHHSRTDIAKRDVAAGHRQGRGIQDQVSKPEPHGAPLAKDALERRLHCLKIEQRLIDVEDDSKEGWPCYFAPIVTFIVEELRPPAK